MEDREVWRTIPSLPSFIASSWGRIMRVPYRGPMPYGGERPYGGVPYWGVWSEEDRRYFFNFKGKNYKIARLVCEAFHGPPPFDGALCLHDDENSRNNRPENLSWGTQVENLAAPKYRALLKVRARTPRKLNATSAAEIRSRVAGGESMAKVAKAYGVSACHVSRICGGHIRKLEAA